MILLNNSINLINPSSLLSYFSGKGRNIDLLSNCNFQEFKYIDGCGEGYFLVNYGAISTSNIKLNLTKGVQSVWDDTETWDDTDTWTEGVNYERSLIVTDSIIFEIDNSPKLQLIKTVELKYILESINATRNYNVIDLKTVVLSTGNVLVPDIPAKTVVQIIKDIKVSIEVVWSTASIRPYNLFIDGLSIREIMDRVCMAYGLLWTAEYSTVTVEPIWDDSETWNDSNTWTEEPYTTQRVTIYVYAGTSLNTTVSLLPNDLNKPHPLQSFKEINTAYPILDNGVQEPVNYFTKSSSSTGGKVITAYNPYYPAIYNPGKLIAVNPSLSGSGIPENITKINSVHNYVKANLENIIKLENYYFVHSHIEPYTHLDSPKALKYTYGHSGTGLRTFLFSGKYPILPIPEHNKVDRQARNVIGQLTYTYKGITIPAFFVTPLFGLDGYIDTATDLYVTNLYKWDYGAAEAKIRIEWDVINHQWIPLQQEYICPPGGEVAPLPPPPEEPTYPIIEF